MTEIHHKHFVPFGQGPRNCIGMKLALLEVQSALAVLLRDNRFATKSVSLHNYLYDYGIIISINPMFFIFL